MNDEPTRARAALDGTVEGMPLSVELDPETWSQPHALAEAKEFYLILYPKEIEERIIGMLESAGVPGYTELPKMIGRGRRIRHFDNQIWPGATGAVFTIVNSGLTQTLVESFQALDEELDRRSHGRLGLHIFSLPCRQII